MYTPENSEGTNKITQLKGTSSLKLTWNLKITLPIEQGKSTEPSTSMTLGSSR